MKDKRHSKAYWNGQSGKRVLTYLLGVELNRIDDVKRIFTFDRVCNCERTPVHGLGYLDGEGVAEFIDLIHAELVDEDRQLELFE
jgi:hypothetical protein